MVDNLYPMFKILVVDDEESHLQVCQQVMQANDITHIDLCQNGQEALDRLNEADVGIMLLDEDMPGMSGHEVLSIAKRQYPNVIVIMLTGTPSVVVAVECIKNGAFDFLSKPITNSLLVSTVRRAIDMCELVRQSERLREGIFTDELQNPEAFRHIITQNRKMRVLFHYAEAIAPSGLPVLIRGETGTGKELFAQVIHKLSGRKGNFVPVNIAGLDDTFLSDTLFGHGAGAFTGAGKARRGLIEKAVDGTLFLDEIGDISMGSQVKLLRLLQEQEYLPLGSDNAKHSNTRIIVATHQDLDELQANGTFRKDLYYRLQVHKLDIPPLRERPDDIPLLLSRIVTKSCKKYGISVLKIPYELPGLLASYPFPGNVRELETTIYDAVSQHQGTTLPLDVFTKHMKIDPDTLSAPNQTATQTDSSNPFNSLKELPTLQAATQLLISEALARCDNKQTTAAKILGISQQALSKRLKKSQ